MWYLFVAYAAGTEHDSDGDAEFSTCALVSGQPSASTDTGRDKLQSRNDSAAVSTGDVTVVCPSGEATESDVTKSATSASIAGHSTHKCSSIFRSCSMPQMCFHSPAVTNIDSRSLDAELRYLSMYAKLRQFESSPLENSKNGRIAKSPYMSPLLASDEILQQLCPVHLMVNVLGFISTPAFNTLIVNL